jgi:hypothetical protein
MILSQMFLPFYMVYGIKRWVLNLIEQKWFL